MYSKLGWIQVVKYKNFFSKFSLLLVMPIMVVSLAHCKDEKVQQQISPPELVVNNTKSSAEIVEVVEPVSANPQFSPENSQFLSKNNPQPCTMPPLKSKIEVSISKQVLYLHCYYDDRQESKTYPVSTSKYGIGNEAGSNKTPLGMHRIEEKFGDGAPKGMVFKGRVSTGKITEMNVQGVGDLITTRILWLKGLEPGINSGPGIDSYRRYIYIHGTVAENQIGQPASHGCVRMYNDDVIELFDLVAKGTTVLIEK